MNVPRDYRMNVNHNWIIYWKNTKIFLRCWERFGIWLSEWFVYLKPIPETMELKRDEMEMFETVQTMMLLRSMRILRRVLEISGNLSQFSAMTITYLVWICKYFNDNNNDKNDKWNDATQIMAQEGCFFFNLGRRNIQGNLGVIWYMTCGNILSWRLSEWNGLLSLKVFLTGPHIHRYDGYIGLCIFILNNIDECAWHSLIKLGVMRGPDIVMMIIIIIITMSGPLIIMFNVIENN